jgi:hypothetical protein
VSTAKEEFLEVVDKVAQWRSPWWLWSGALVLLAVSSLLSALALQPGPDEFVYLSGVRVGDTCASITFFGIPCPQCGMTRSFVHGARFHVARAIAYNPAGYALFLWFQVAGVIGAVRLVTRRRDALRPPWNLLAAWIGVWFVLLWFVPWVARLAGVNPLP